MGINLFAYCFNNPVNYFDPTGEIAVETVILIVSIVVGVAVAGYTAYVEYEAGCDTVQIIGDSICNGLAAFNIVYTAGMSLYQLYQNFCYLHGLTPVTEFGNSNVIATHSQTQIEINTGIQNSGYHAPVGGGGVTDTIQIGDTTVTFGHGGRHLTGGLTTAQVHPVIANDVVNRNLSVGSFISDGQVAVDGTIVLYTACAWKENVINVGTYHIR